MVLAVTDDTNQAIQRVLQQLGHDASVAAIDDAGTDDRGPQIRRRRLQHELLVRRPPTEQLPRIRLSRLVHRLRIRS